MPRLLEFICDNCNFSISVWEGGTIYVTDPNGKRINCPHPGESYKIAQVLNIPEEEIMGFPYFRVSNPDLYPLLNEWVGVLTKCVCMGCAKVKSLDIEKDSKICSSCHSESYVPADNLAGETCPKCHSGVFQFEDPGVIS